MKGVHKDARDVAPAHEVEEALRVMPGVLEASVSVGAEDDEGTEVHQAGCLRSLGAAYGDVGQDEQLIQYTIQALELFRKLPHSEFGQASCLNNLGVAYGRLKQHEARIRVTEQALELYRKLEGTEADQAGCLQNLANAYSFLGQTDKMVEFTKQALALYQAVQGTEADDHGDQIVSALVPTSELARYAVDLRSMTGGRGRFKAVHDHYEPMPAHLVDKAKASLKAASS